MQHRVIIGNYLTTAPNGIAFIVDDKAAFCIDTGAPYRAGWAAPDDSYHSTEYELNGAKIRFEWGRRGDNVLAKLSSDRPAAIPLRLIQSWPDMPARYMPDADGVRAISGGIDWEVRADPPPIRVSDKEFVVSAGPQRPAHLVAGLRNQGERYEGSVDIVLRKSERDYAAIRPRVDSADWGDFLGAIADNLNNSRIYSSDNHVLAHTVSRGWASTPNTAPYFCWDSFFNGNLACIDDPETARNTVRAILSCQTAEGLVPNFGHWNFAGGRVSIDRSQPPVGALCVWKMQQRWPDKTFLKEVFPRLLKWHRWWPKARDGNHNGLLEWGSATGQLQGAKWETGWDDTVHFEGAAMAGPNMNADAVDLNSMWAMDAEYLSLIAKEIGNKDAAKALVGEYMTTCERIDKELWNPDLGVYCSKMWDGRFLARLTPMNFYPLIAGVPNRERADKVLAVITDPKRFWGDWILPTVAYDDPVWPKQDYWRGKVWAPVNYLVFQGLLRYASPEILNRFADRSRELFMRNWTAKGVCGENYLSSTGEQSSDPHYTWGALLCLIALENVVCVEPDGRIRLNGTLRANAVLHNVPIRGRRYTVFVSPGKTELVSDRNGRAVITAEGSVARAKLP